jgi:ribosomal protein S18 acetylase RimI-like enzyme
MLKLRNEMQSKLNIRKATPADLPAIVELWKDLMDFHSDLDPFFSRSHDGHENFLKWVEKQQESENAELLVADSSGKILGYIKIELCNYPPVFELEKYGMISDAAVAKEYRRNGIGEALYGKAMDWFDEKGMTRIELRVADVNSVAWGFWEKMGFRPYMTTMFKEK